MNDAIRQFMERKLDNEIFEARMKNNKQKEQTAYIMKNNLRTKGRPT